LTGYLCARLKGIRRNQKENENARTK